MPYEGEGRLTLTIVADIPGYPIRKLPFGGPDTRTKAAMLRALHPHHHGAAERDALRSLSGGYATSTTSNSLKGS